ncbi:MAG TPA: GGDEF domain-containing protein [Verrucomicrobiae bacterium]|jgi:diguanylate cyclase (GGDEF)-like protein|nr:GGDEF domain-containing protein [Verrucomicrobiae bacterium]
MPRRHSKQQIDTGANAWTVLHEAAYGLVVPGGLLLVVAVVLARLELFSSPTAARIVGYCPYVVFGAGMLLSAIFRRSRLFFAFLALGVAGVALIWVQPELATKETRKMLLDAIALLLPLNLMTLAFLRERGIVSAAGRRRFAAIAAQIAVVWLLCQPAVMRVVAPLDRDFLRGLTDGSRISQPSLVAFLIAAIVLAISLLRRYRPVESSLLWSMAAVFLAIETKASGTAAGVYYAAAGLSLMVAVVETSYAMAYRDELTQLPSRRALNEALLQLGGPYTVAMLDVDHFKKFNDTYGHEAGDHALRMVASRLAHIGSGKAYRYGGEEFAIVFPGKSLAEAFATLEYIRRTIEQSNFVVRGRDRRAVRRKRRAERETSVTVSIGVAEYAGDRLRPQDLLKLADKALYRAKAKGRNCTVATRGAKEASRVPIMVS